MPDKLEAVVSRSCLAVHRVLRCICLFGASACPALSGSFAGEACNAAGAYFIKNPAHEPLPSFTQMWLAGVTNGDISLGWLGALMGVLVAAIGLFLLFTRKFSEQTAATSLLFVCCIGYSAGFVILSSSLIAVMLPFVKLAPS